MQGPFDGLQGRGDEGYWVESAEPTFEERVWQVVSSIPAGCVATYGQIAELAGEPRRARHVGRVLGALPQGSRLPWHRVVNASGRSSLPGAAGAEQRRRLRDEGVRFKQSALSLSRYRWEP
ncbi:MAG: MGMT family protein [Gammaproteobacteria bacterium]|nr:MGMT family protein [Gammaproteobacteria bacterium]